MATVKGFRGIRYNPEKVENFGDVLAPPYDVINAQEQQELYNKDEHNVIRLILAKGEEDSKYEEAAKTFRSWIEEDILTSDEEPSIYPYSTTWPSRASGSRPRSVGRKWMRTSRKPLCVRPRRSSPSSS